MAKELNMGNKELVRKLQELGYPVKSHSSTLEDFLAAEIKSRISGKKVQPRTETTGRPKVIRRRKKEADVAVPVEMPPIVVDETALTTSSEEVISAESFADEIMTSEASPVSEYDDQPEFEPEREAEPEMMTEPETPPESRESQPEVAAKAKPPVEEPELEAMPLSPEEQELAPEISSVEETAEPVFPEQTATEETAMGFENAAAFEPPSEAATATVGQPAEEKAEAIGPEDVVVTTEAMAEVKAETEAEAEADVEVEVKAEAEAEPKATVQEKAAVVSPEPSEPAKSQKAAEKRKGREKDRRGKERKVTKTQLATDTRLAQPIKRIEKTTAEPARIISRPKIELTPKPAPPTVGRAAGGEKKVVERPAPSSQQQEKTQAPSRKRQGQPVPFTPEVAGGDGHGADARKTRKKKKSSRDAGGPDAFGRFTGSRRREIIEKADLYDDEHSRRSGRGRKSSKAVKKQKKTEITQPKAIKRRIKIMDAITVADLAKKIGIKAAELIRKLISMGMVANINQAIDFDSANLVAAEFGFEVEKGSFDEEEVLHLEETDEVAKSTRPPVVTIMGHVDHGKTSLLDAIRQTNVIEGEAGGITQHIGAYHVNLDSGNITFLDTPGHEAFTAMRARGAQVTDIVVLIVAADDGVMQQTREAADHARAANVPIIVAVNKIDKPEAEPDRVRRELTDIGLVPEAWGGDIIFVDVSAKTGQGVDELLELILLQAEMMDLKAAPDGRAVGHIVEARLDKGRGPVATVLVQSGLLKQGDSYVCGVYHGKVRAMFDDKGNRVVVAGPSIPVEIQGISGVPQAGDEFVAVEDEKKSKQVSQYRQLKQRENELLKTSKVTLENLFDSIKEGGVKELNLVLKADVQGSLEAITDALVKLGTDEIKINLVTSSTGAISETDIMLASASNALVVGFNVRPNAKVQDLAEMEKIQIRYYDIIYKLIDEIKESMAGMLDPIHQEKTLGRAQVRDTFHVSKIGVIAGCAVTDGKVIRGAKARLLREDVVIYDGKIDSLKRFKDDAKEVVSGYECGIGLENYDDIKVGDVIEAYLVEEIAATLS